ncbi:MAG: DUF1499 domain-containing protein [Paracoccaceae bacterium]
MRRALAVLWLILAGLMAAAGWVRLAPVGPVAFHAEPLMAAKLSGSRDWLVRVEGGDAVAPVFAGGPVELMARLAAAALAEPRTRVLAGRPEEAWMSFVQRSAIVGYPDVISVRTFPQGGGATLAIWSRSRFGGNDWGVNRARAERWIAALGAPLAR